MLGNNHNYKTNQNSQGDLTQGRITKQLILFSVPLLASSLIQHLYNTVDLIFVGQFIGKVASAAVSASSLLVACIVGFFTGISIGVNVLAARYFGSRNFSMLKTVISVAFLLSVFSGVIFVVAGYALAPFLLRLLDTPAESLNMAIDYLRIYVMSMLATSIYSIGSGILRGIGDARSPMLYQLIGGIFNVLVNVLFLVVFKWGVAGAAIATLVSQSMAATLVVIHLFRLDKQYRLSFKGIRALIPIIKELLGIGIPSGVQVIAQTLSNLIVQTHINRLGVDSTAAFATYFKVELFVYLPIVAIGQANVTFTGQNTGAGLPNRARKGTNTSIGIGLTLTITISLVLFLMRKYAFRVFSTDGDVIALGISIAAITLPFYFIYVFIEVYASFIRGIGKTIPPTIIILINMCLIRPVFVAVMSNITPSATTIAYVYPVTWLTTSVCMFICYSCYNRRLGRSIS